MTDQLNKSAACARIKQQTSEATLRVMSDKTGEDSPVVPAHVFMPEITWRVILLGIFTSCFTS